MKASELLNITSEIEITNITNNSREVVAGGLYFALEGLTVDGHDYIQNAIDNGAVAIVHTKDVEEVAGVVYLKVSDMNAAYNEISSKFWGYPTNNLKIIGATGTNGKSTTAWILDDILNSVYNSGYIGTIGIKTDNILKSSPFTTLLPHQYNQIFAEMVASSKDYATIEVSSQGLDQHRTDFIDFDYAIMTNLTHDHLDYHLTMENYLQAKGLLFTSLKPDGKAIINNDDDASAEYLKSITNGRVVTYGIDNSSDVWAKDVKLLADSSEFTLSYFGQEYPIVTNLVGKFNVYNLLAAIAVALDCGISVEQLQSTVQKLSQVAGRMEIVENDQDLNIIVDYAHTPDGFTQVYNYVKAITTGKVISVFGAAGERDFVKRPTLGKIGAEASDYIILTEEDCLGEDPYKIAMEVASGIEGTPYEYIGDREQAIAKAFSIAEPGDSVVMLSKGQEEFQKRAEGKVPYPGDINVSKAQLAKRK